MDSSNQNTPSGQTTSSAIKKPKVINMAQSFFQMEASGGIMLVIMAIIALFIANSPLYVWYDYILHDVKFNLGFSDPSGNMGVSVNKSVLLWINDGFMAIFFFLVGLEIKREIMEGELSSRSRALLPAIAAVGGMIVPAAIYYWINMDTPENLNGWAIPAATDIAFALGVLSLLGSKAPVRLKILLTAIAIIDDIGAILIIALFYSGNIWIDPLYFGVVALIGLFILNNRGVSSLTPYFLLSFILWFAVLKSGVHATLAGVVAAFFIPLSNPKDPKHSPCKTLEHALHPWVAFGILPIFAFANAGVPFDGMSLKSLFEPTTLGIILGLVVGKQLGIFTMLWLSIKSGLSPMPSNTTWFQLYGVSALCGIGFTMSLFIGGLAFDDQEHQAYIRLGILVGSTISAIIGYLVIRYCPDHAKKMAKQDAKNAATQSS